MEFANILEQAVGTIGGGGVLAWIWTNREKILTIWNEYVLKKKNDNIEQLSNKIIALYDEMNAILNDYDACKFVTISKYQNDFSDLTIQSLVRKTVVHEVNHTKDVGNRLDMKELFMGNPLDGFTIKALAKTINCHRQGLGYYMKSTLTDTDFTSHRTKSFLKDYNILSKYSFILTYTNKKIYMLELYFDKESILSESDKYKLDAWSIKVKNIFENRKKS